MEVLTLNLDCDVALSPVTSNKSATLGAILVPIWNGERCEDSYGASKFVAEALRGGEKADYTFYEFFLENAAFGVRDLFDAYYQSVTQCPPMFCDPSFFAALGSAIAEDTFAAFSQRQLGPRAVLDPNWAQFFSEVPDLDFDAYDKARKTLDASVPSTARPPRLPQELGEEAAHMLLLMRAGRLFGRAHVVASLKRVLDMGFPGMFPSCCQKDCLTLVGLLERTFVMLLGKVQLYMNGMSAFDSALAREAARRSFRRGLLESMAEGYFASKAWGAVECGSALGRLAAAE